MDIWSVFLEESSPELKHEQDVRICSDVFFRRSCLQKLRCIWLPTNGSASKVLNRVGICREESHTCDTSVRHEGPGIKHQAFPY